MHVSGLHAEAYPSAEFRHGPLALIDDIEKTPAIYIVLNDEHRSQVLSNILQVKERGATIIVVTNLPNIGQFIDLKKLDYIIQLPEAEEPEYFSALQAVIPLQMICYQTCVKRGLDPDLQLEKAIDFENELDWMQQAIIAHQLT